MRNRNQYTGNLYRTRQITRQLPIGSNENEPVSFKRDREIERERQRESDRERERVGEKMF